MAIHIFPILCKEYTVKGSSSHEILSHHPVSLQKAEIRNSREKAGCGSHKLCACKHFSTTIHECFYNLGKWRGRGVSHSVTMWSRVISLSERHPLNAMVSSNSSRSIWSTFLMPASPSAAKENTTGRPICHRRESQYVLNRRYNAKSEL